MSLNLDTSSPHVGRMKFFPIFGFQNRSKVAKTEPQDEAVSIHISSLAVTSPGLEEAVRQAREQVKYDEAIREAVEAQKEIEASLAEATSSAAPAHAEK